MGRLPYISTRRSAGLSVPQLYSPICSCSFRACCPTYLSSFSPYTVNFPFILSSQSVVTYNRRSSDEKRNVTNQSCWLLWVGYWMPFWLHTWQEMPLGILETSGTSLFYTVFTWHQWFVVCCIAGWFFSRSVAGKGERKSTVWKQCVVTTVESI